MRPVMFNRPSKHLEKANLDLINFLLSILDQSSWVTQGEKIGQMALFFGANDMGSLMIEENVVASAGTVHYLTLEQIKAAIREVGYIPRQRNVFYQYVDEVPQGSVA